MFHVFYNWFTRKFIAKVSKEEVKESAGDFINAITYHWGKTDYYTLHLNVARPEIIIITKPTLFRLGKIVFKGKSWFMGNLGDDRPFEEMLWIDGDFRDPAIYMRRKTYYAIHDILVEKIKEAGIELIDKK